jgi:hypothetical protein
MYGKPAAITKDPSQRMKWMLSYTATIKRLELH